MANLLIALTVVSGFIWQISPTPLEQNCKNSTSGGCFWTEYGTIGKNFSEANSTCASHGSVLAVIPDAKTYDEIVEDARVNMREIDVGARHIRGFWLGMTYNPANNTVYPLGAFNGKWHVKYPKSNPHFTRVLLSVRLNPEARNQGLLNVKPFETRTQRGVVCWKPRSDCQVTYNGKCFWIEGRGIHYLKFDNGSQICSAKGGTVGNIYAKSQYDQILGHMEKSAIFTKYQMYSVWIGLKYDSLANNVTLSDGNPAPYVSWLPGYPMLHVCCRMFIYTVFKENAGTFEGMANSDGDHALGVLCEK